MASGRNRTERQHMASREVRSEGASLVGPTAQCGQIYCGSVLLMLRGPLMPVEQKPAERSQKEGQLTPRSHTQHILPDPGGM